MTSPSETFHSMSAVTYSAGEAAALIGCSRHTVHRLIAAGELDVVPLMGRCKRIKRGSLAALLGVADLSQTKETNHG